MTQVTDMVAQQAEADSHYSLLMEFIRSECIDVLIIGDEIIGNEEDIAKITEKLKEITDDIR